MSTWSATYGGRASRNLALVVALVAACGCSSSQARIESAYQAAGQEDYVAWMFDQEYEALAGDLPETEMLRMADKGAGKWPASWELHALRASSLVRQGRATEAVTAHDTASGLYYLDPYCGDPLNTHTTNMGLALGLGLVGGIIAEINAATTDDVVIGYPVQPTKETWSPSYWRDAFRCSEEYTPSQIGVLSAAAKAREASGNSE